MSVREPDFAGTWYPASERECLRTFERFEADCVERTGTDPPLGGIVPHAGWIFSGRIAYNVIRELARHNDEADTVVLFGGHLRPSSSASVLAEGSFWTPLGEILVDGELAGLIAERAGLRRESPAPHTPDNTIELQTPIIRHLLPHARLVAITAPPRPETLALADALVELAMVHGRSLVVLGSTDLTHYGPNYGWAPQGRGPRAEAWVRGENDRRLIELACQLEAAALIDEALERSNACCPGAAAAALQCGQRLGARRGELLTYATSADCRPDDSFVGYAGILF